jgi:hypothetical protein
MPEARSRCASRAEQASKSPTGSAEADANAVKHSSLRSSRVEHESPRGAHATKVAAASRKRTRYGYTPIVRMADVDRTHLASCPPGGRKTSWRQQGASRKEARSPSDTGHVVERRRSGAREHSANQNLRRALGLRIPRRRKAIPGSRPPRPHRRGETDALGSQVIADRAARRPTRACQGSDTGIVRGRRAHR